MNELNKKGIWKSYKFPIILILSIIAGSIIGLIAGPKAEVLKPLGDIFINLMFTIVVPLVFISISSSVANISSLKRLGKILGVMLLVFVFTGIIASIVMIMGVSVFPPAEGVHVEMQKPDEIKPLSTSEQIVSAFTVPDFLELFSRKNMLALIVFSVLFGLSISMLGEKGRKISAGLSLLSDAIMKLVSIIMLFAPIGLGAYFATLIGVFGPELLGSYAKSMAVYYPIAIVYFFVAFTIYSFMAGGKRGTTTFWKEIITPAATSFATGSSVATIPANLVASARIGVPRDIREMVIPIGATAHMDGSCLSAILKISFLFGLYNMSFTGIDTFATAILVAVLSGMVASGIPGGGFVGELLIVTMYGFPPEALVIISMLGTLVDPPATMVNSTGDTVCGMMMARIIEGKNWMVKKLKPSEMNVTEYTSEM
ncbi:dicarboxylate/amino acid:cation symporter [Heyndrickxia sp. NPDC080065]|uniref:dicarboxylate/amino acid:cation symporter n=1 Tax=Heyndrickxia sp. NPDC080065 TaxID=3390568 RepID=UPI003CFE6805